MFSGVGAFTGTGNELANVATGGAGNDILNGVAGNDTLNGGAGNDILNGGVGNDTLVGGAGNDVYGVIGDDVVIELAGGGVDTVYTINQSHTLGANVENLVFSGVGAFTGTGNGLANAITGGAGNDTLNGGAGNDTLTGGLGNDIFVFGLSFGNDIINGFDANPAGGQDLLNIAAFNLTAATFASRVAIADAGADALVTINGADGGSIRLVGVADHTSVTQADFQLA
ncbi:RTX calcium-binding nonapeptide repeat (4 copies) [compost metagenome]